MYKMTCYVATKNDQENDKQYAVYVKMKKLNQWFAVLFYQGMEEASALGILDHSVIKKGESVGLPLMHIESGDLSS